MVWLLAHEVADRVWFFKQILGILKPGGKILLAEPKCHVGEKLYAEICNDAKEVRMKKIFKPWIGGSQATLFAALSV